MIPGATRTFGIIGVLMGPSENTITATQAARRFPTSLRALSELQSPVRMELTIAVLATISAKAIVVTQCTDGTIRPCRVCLRARSVPLQLETAVVFWQANVLLESDVFLAVQVAQARMETPPPVVAWGAKSPAKRSRVARGALVVVPVPRRFAPPTATQAPVALQAAPGAPRTPVVAQ